MIISNVSTNVYANESFPIARKNISEENNQMNS